MMNKKSIVSVLTVFALICLLGIFFQANHLEAEDLLGSGSLPQLVIVPEHSDIPTKGTTLQIRVNLEPPTGANVTNLKGWQLKMKFNQAVLQCTGAALVPGHPFEVCPGGYQAPPPNIDNTAGTVSFMCITTSVSDYVNVTTTAPLCNFTFSTIAVGVSTLSFLNVNQTGGTYLLNNTGSKIFLEVTTGEVVVYGALKVKISQERNLWIRDEIFSANVTLEVQGNITGLQNWQAKIIYNTSALDCVDVSESSDGPFTNVTHSFHQSINETVGELVCGALTDYYNVVDVPEGNWSLCSLSFNATAKGFCRIEFTDINVEGGTYLLDKNNFQMAFEIVQGDINICALGLQPTCPMPYVPSDITRADEPVFITVESDLTFKLSYRVSGGEWWNTNMSKNVTSGLWTVTIPGQPGNSIVEFYLTANDQQGNTLTSSTRTIDVKALPIGDINGDSMVEMMDFFIMSQHYLEQT